MRAVRTAARAIVLDDADRLGRPAHSPPMAAPPEPRGLTVKRILMEDRDARLVAALAEDGQQQPAVVVLTKPPFTGAQVTEILSSEFASTEEHRNDKFSKHSLDVPARLNGVTATMICPANEVDVAKYTQQERHLVRETAELYRAATEPFVAALPPKQLAWVWNILDHKKEVESIIDESEHYVLLPDTKWDQADAKLLHCLAIAKDRSLHSLRDLRGAHLPMLRHTLAGGRAALRRVHGAAASQLRVYVHYLPSFWQLHVHFAALTCAAVGGGTSVGKAVLLEECAPPPPPLPSPPPPPGRLRSAPPAAQSTAAPASVLGVRCGALTRVPSRGVRQHHRQPGARRRALRQVQPLVRPRRERASLREAAGAPAPGRAAAQAAADGVRGGQSE